MNRKKHLLIVRSSLTSMNLSSYNVQELGLAKELQKRGYKVSVIMGAGEESVSETEFCTVYFLKYRRVQQAIGYFIHLNKTLKEINPDLIQIHEIGMVMSAYVAWWAKRHVVPCVLIQGPYDETRKPFLRRLEQCFNATIGRYILHTVGSVGCKTPAAAEYLKKYGLRKGAEITPVGLDDSNFSFKDGELSDWRERNGIGSERKVLLYVGSVEVKRRHVDLLVGIMSFLPEEYLLVIVGDGSSRAELQSSTVSERVFWTGALPQSKLPDIYKCADLFLLASDFEIYGMVVLEALYWGVAVLSTPTGGACSIIEDGLTGYLIDSFDEKEWARKVVSIFGEPEKLHYISESGQRHVRNHLLWKQTADNFVALYDNVLSAVKKNK